MRTAMAVALVVVAGGCTPTLEPGDYQLRVSADAFWSSIDATYAVAANGTLGGNVDGVPYVCAGALSVQDHAALTAALNRADVLDQGDIAGDCIDNTVWTIAIDGVAGAAAGHANQFEYDRCDQGHAALDDVIDLLDFRFAALQQNGYCTACPAGDDGSCLGDELGADRFCRDGAYQGCDDAATGTVVGCRGRQSLECLPSAGWVPATRWSIVEATRTRTTHEPEGWVTIALALTLDVDNVGDLERWLSAEAYLRFTDPATGAELINGCSTAAPTASPDTHAQYVVTMSCNDGIGEVATAPALDVQLRERPWDGAPFAAPVAVTIVDRNDW